MSRRLSGDHLIIQTMMIICVCVCMWVCTHHVARSTLCGEEHARCAVPGAGEAPAVWSRWISRNG